MNNFGKILKELRKENDLSIWSLSLLIGVSDTTISRWENGINDIKSEELIKLAKLFHVTIDYLVGIED